MNSSAKSRIFPPSATAGARTSHRPDRLIGAARRIGSSLTLKLVLVVGVFIAGPVVLAARFEDADRKMRDLVARGIERQNSLIAAALRPVLDAPQKLPSNPTEKLTEFAGDNSLLKLMLRPASGPGAGAFYFVGSAPPIGPAQIDAELDRLGREGVLDELSPTCSWQAPAQVRHM